jgi:hypothetical protein
MEARREELFGQSAYCSSIPALSPRKRAGHQALAPLLTRPRYEAPGAWMEIEMAALLDFSAADFLGFFASRFDFGGRLGNYLVGNGKRLSRAGAGSFPTGPRIISRLAIARQHRSPVAKALGGGRH